MTSFSVNMSRTEQIIRINSFRNMQHYRHKSHLLCSAKSPLSHDPNEMHQASKRFQCGRRTCSKENILSSAKPTAVILFYFLTHFTVRLQNFSSLFSPTRSFYFMYSVIECSETQL